MQEGGFMNEKEFGKDLLILVEKHEIKNAVFGGEHEDRFIGLIGIPLAGSISEFAKSVESSARLYQAAREKLYKYLDRMAGRGV
jgi:hypothetical protein